MQKKNTTNAYQSTKFNIENNDNSQKKILFLTHTRCCETQPPLFTDLSEIENIPNSENVGSARIFKIKKKPIPPFSKTVPNIPLCFFFFLKFQKHFGTCKNSKYEIRPNCRFRGYCQFAFRR